MTTLPDFDAAYEELSKDPWLAENEPARLERLKEFREQKLDARTQGREDAMGE